MNSPSLSVRTKALAACAGLFVGVLGLEAGVRCVAWVASREPIVTYDAALGWAQRANARTVDHAGDVPFEVQINTNGLRDDPHEYNRRDGTFRIVALGDSFTFGYGGVEQPQRFTEVLETKLEGVEVINMGVVGFSLDQEYLYLRHEGLRYQPDLVMVFLYENDFLQCFMSRAYGSPKGYFLRVGESLEFHPPRLTWFFRLSQDSWALRYLDRHLYFARRGSDLGYETIVDPAEQDEVFAMLLRAMNQVSREAGAEFIMVHIPERDGAGNGRVQAIAAAVAEDERLHFVDLGKTPEFSEPDVSRQYYFRRDHHLNANGHSVVAEILYHHLSPYRSDPSGVSR